MPKLRLAASVPAIDWKTRSTGAPLRISSSVVVTWASTQLWVGMSSLLRISSSIASSRCARAGLSVAGLMPITASPAPSSRPSRMLAAMPRASSVGWLGCSRTERRPGRPMVERKRVTTAHFAAITARSCSRLIFATAAAISGVMPGASADKTVRGRRVGQQPVAEGPDREMRDGRERGLVVGVDDEARDLVGLVGNRPARTGMWRAAGRRGRIGRRRAPRPIPPRRRRARRRCAAASPWRAAF